MAMANFRSGKLNEVLPVIQVGGVLFIVTLLATALPGSRSAPAVVNKNTAEITYNVEYSRPDAIRLLLDATIPDAKGSFPAAIIVHGGYWVEGSKTTYVGPLEPLLTSAGYAWFSIDYRLPPRYRYPTAIADVETAVRWVRTHAELYHVDLNRIVLIG